MSKSRLEEVKESYDSLKIEERKFKDRVEYWSGQRILTIDWICAKCRSIVLEDDVEFALPNGTMSVRDGQAYCQNCLKELKKSAKNPEENSLKKEIKKISKKIRSKK